MALTVRYARWDERGTAMTLVDQLWRRGHRLSHDAALFDWMFRDRRHLWDQDAYSFAIACQDEEAVGIHAGIPFRLNFEGKAALGLWRMLWIVTPEPKAGNAGLLLHRAVDRNPYINVSFGINEVVAKFYNAIGYKLVEDIPRHFMVLPGRRRIAGEFLAVAYPDWEQRRRDDLIDCFSSAWAGGGGDYAVSDKPDSDWDGAGWSRIALSVNGAVRDLDYLNWRYVRHPGFTYHLVSLRHHGLPALAVWRKEPIRAALGGEPLCHMARVVEFLLPDPAAARPLYQALLDDMMARGVDIADYYGYHAPTTALLEEFGFRRSDLNGDGPLIPTRFQPLEGGGGRIKSGIHLPCHLSPPVYPGIAGGNWLWTKGDSDQDRPN